MNHNTGDFTALVEMARAGRQDAIDVLRKMVHAAADVSKPDVLIRVVELLVEIREGEGK